MPVDADFNVWEGVYANFKDAPASGPGFDGRIWRERSAKFALQMIDRVSKGEPLEMSLRQRYEFLPVLAVNALERQPRTQILDFGGGLGIGYVVLESALGQGSKRVDYSVVEFEDTCRAGLELFAGRPGPDFLRELPNVAHFDIVHAASVLQYIEDWREILCRLAAYRAPHLALSDVYIGDFATYVTSQNHHTSRIRHWFWNKTEFVNEVSRHGYELCLHTHCELNVLGKHGSLPMQNFPQELRIAHGSNLLFRRRERGAAR